MKIQVLQTMHQESGLPTSGLLQIDHKLRKWQWRYNFLTWRFSIFLMLFCFSKFSYLSKFHVNIITCSGVMTISFYKGLTRIPEIGNTPVWVLPNIWSLVWVRNIKFGANVSNKMLLTAAKCQGYNFYRFWVIKGQPAGGKITPYPTQIRVKKINEATSFGPQAK